MMVISSESIRLPSVTSKRILAVATCLGMVGVQEKVLVAGSKVAPKGRLEAE